MVPVIETIRERQIKEGDQSIVRPDLRDWDPATRSSVSIVHIDAAASRRPHVHPTCEELIVVFMGEGWLWEENVVSRLRPGDIAYVKHGVSHCTFAKPGTPLELLCFFPKAQAIADRIVADDVIKQPMT